jgi:hypothetical protein
MAIHLSSSDAHSFHSRLKNVVALSAAVAPDRRKRLLASAERTVNSYS